MGVLWLLANGIGLGLGAAAPVGPVNVEIARRTLRFGRPAGFALGCGAVTVDVAYAVVASVASARVLEWPGVASTIGVAGGLFLGYLGVMCLRSFARATAGAVAASSSSSIESGPASPPGEVAGLTHDEGNYGTPAPAVPTVPAARLRGHYAHGLLMTGLNPMTLVFWFVGVPGAVAKLTADARASLPPVCAGVFAGALAWVCFFTWLIGRLGRLGRERWLRWVDLAGGAVLLAFATGAIWRVARAAL